MWTEQNVEGNQRKTSESPWQLHASYVRDEEVSPCDVSVTPVTRARVTRGVTPRHEMSRADVTMSQDPPPASTMPGNTQFNKTRLLFVYKNFPKNKRPTVENDCDTSKPFHLHACLRCWMDRACRSVFGCESSPISRNVRSSVSPLVRQMQSKAY